MIIFLNYLTTKSFLNGLEDDSNGIFIVLGIYELQSCANGFLKFVWIIYGWIG
jgi:hypothetical protein